MQWELHSISMLDGHGCIALQAVLAGASTYEMQTCKCMARFCCSQVCYCNLFLCRVQAKETLEQQQPPEVRILKQLLRIQSPQERQTALFDAFEPGADLSTQEQDLLHT